MKFMLWEISLLLKILAYPTYKNYQHQTCTDFDTFRKKKQLLSVVFLKQNKSITFYSPAQYKHTPLQMKWYEYLYR